MRYVEKRLKLNLDIKTPGRLELVYLYYTLIACYENGRADLAEQVILSHYGLLRAETPGPSAKSCFTWAKATAAVRMDGNRPTFFMMERMLGAAGPAPSRPPRPHRARIADPGVGRRFGSASAGHDPRFVAGEGPPATARCQGAGGGTMQNPTCRAFRHAAV